jgi:hypothetical protein
VSIRHTVVDSRERNQGQRSYEGLSNELKQKVACTVSPEGLDDRAGLFAIDFTQSMDNPALTIDAFGGVLRRRATAAPQSAELTNWVARVFSETAVDPA